MPMNANAKILIVVLNSCFKRQGNGVHVMCIDTPLAGVSSVITDVTCVTNIARMPFKTALITAIGQLSFLDHYKTKLSEGGPCPTYS